MPFKQNPNVQMYSNTVGSYKIKTKKDCVCNVHMRLLDQPIQYEKVLLNARLCEIDSTVSGLSDNILKSGYSLPLENRTRVNITLPKSKRNNSDLIQESLVY